MSPNQHISKDAAFLTVFFFVFFFGQDWYRVSVTQRQANKQPRNRFRASSTRSLIRLLQLAHPQHEWKVEDFSRRNKRAEQRALKAVLKQIFHNYTIVEEFSDPEAMKYRSGQKIVLDLFIPDLKLGFEYQGKQHAQDVLSYSVESQKQRDEEKAAASKAANVRLVDVPATWDGTKEQILSLLRDAGVSDILLNDQKHMKVS